MILYIDRDVYILKQKWNEQNQMMNKGVMAKKNFD